MSSLQDTNLTVLIPTFNRPYWLNASLHFLANYGSNIQVIILDGSSEENKKLNRRSVFSAGANFSLHEFPSDLHMALRIREGLEKVQTEYTLIWPDDDFIIPTNLNKITDFLDQNPDYSAAIGKVMCLLQVGRLRKVFPKSSFYLVDHLKFSTAIKDSAILRRVMNYFMLTRLGSIPLFYSVRRTTQLLQTFDRIKSHHTLTTMELISNLDCLFEGKVGFLNVPFGFRNYVSKPTDCANREGSDSYFPSRDIDEIHEEFVGVLDRKHGWSKEVAMFSLKQIISAPYDYSEYTYGDGMPLSKTYPFLKFYSFLLVCLNLLRWPWQKKLYGFEKKDFDSLTCTLSLSKRNMN